MSALAQAPSSNVAALLVARGFRRAWVTDFEYQQFDGERPTPHCMVRRCVLTGITEKLWLEPGMPSPFSGAKDELMIAYAADAELGCFSVLGWAAPAFVLDLFPEFLRMRNGWPRVRDHDGLIDAMAFFGLPSLGADEKDRLRRLAMRGGPYTEAERRALLEYCLTDVIATEMLLKRLLFAAGLEAQAIFEQALIRGGYLVAVAAMRAYGVPINCALLKRLVKHWGQLKLALIERLGAPYGVYENGHFRAHLFTDLLGRLDLLEIWPGTENSNALSLSEDTFSDMAQIYPVLSDLHQLRQTLGQLRLMDLAIGPDGRNRVYLAPYRTKTSRNDPSNSQFVYGGAKWIRNLILAPRGYGLAYCDWTAQEVGIAAALSGDGALWEAAASGDPYTAFGKAIDCLPGDATKDTHPEERALFKIIVLGVLYGMTAFGLARRANIAIAEAEDLLVRLRETYPRYWDWAKRNSDAALLGYPLTTRLGWTLHYAEDSLADASERTAVNFPMQANGAEIMRQAAIRGVRAGIVLCAPIHDAFLLEARADELADASRTFRRIMADSAEAVLGSGYRIEADSKPPSGRSPITSRAALSSMRS